MLSLDEILSYYPKELQKYEQFIFKEYLQYIILKIIFESNYSNKLSFLGGTNLRIVHNNKRFSEDLDFDNFGLTIKDFDDLSIIVKNNLENLGFEVEIKNVYKGAYRCSIKIPKILRELGFSNMDTEKILIQIDSVSHDYNYKIENKVLNKFGLIFTINSTPLDVIASQKIYAILNRKRSKGRDFCDLVFILSKTKPDIKYLYEKLGFKDLQETKKELLDFCENLDFQQLINDVEPFLFDEEGKKNIKYFKEIINDYL